MMMMMMMMPGSASACDAPQPKRKKVAEPTESMRRRLVEHGRSRWTQEQYDSMTNKQLKKHLGELGLKRRGNLTLSMEDYSPDLSWEECLEIKAAEEKAAAAAAADTPQPKSKKVAEPTASMRRRLAEHGDPRWPQEQCDSMTKKQLKKHLGELGLKRCQKLTVSMEDYSPDLSWEECLEIKAAEEKAAAAKAAKAEKAAAAGQFDASGQIIPVKQQRTYTTADGVEQVSDFGAYEYGNGLLLAARRKCIALCKGMSDSAVLGGNIDSNLHAVRMLLYCYRFVGGCWHLLPPRSTFPLMLDLHLSLESRRAIVRDVQAWYDDPSSKLKHSDQPCARNYTAFTTVDAGQGEATFGHLLGYKQIMQPVLSSWRGRAALLRPAGRWHHHPGPFLGPVPRPQLHARRYHRCRRLRALRFAPGWQLRLLQASTTERL
eukprot:COSAG05_NODE_31_length_28416_cov_170.150652_21_plen_432_part_00